MSITDNVTAGNNVTAAQVATQTRFTFAGVSIICPPMEPPQDNCLTMSDSKYRSTPSSARGMPGGIPYIVGNEAAERFSYYGMKAILVIFMTEYLVNADGELDVMSDAKATEINHLFIAAAYFFPVLGALLSDIFIGKYKTILSLSIVYCLGHLALALDDTFLGLSVGLTLIAVGAGGIKPCVSAHVGDQFGKTNQHLLPRVFAWFYFSINLGSFFATLLIPELLDRYGPHVAFGLPGALMLLATFVFWLGRRKFIHVPPGGRQFIKAIATPEGCQVAVRISVVFLFIVPFWSLFDQQSSALVLQARSMDRTWLGHEWLPAQISSVNPIMILAFIPLFGFVIYPAMRLFFQPTPLRKISIGLFVMVFSFVLLAWVETRISGGRVVNWDSEARGKKWPVQALINGKADGQGWASRPVKKMEFAAEERNKATAKKQKKDPASAGEEDQDPPLEQLTFRLRERREWTISKVRITPFTKPQPGEEDLKDDNKFNHKKCWIKDIRLEVGDAPKGKWRKVRKFTLKQTGDPQTFNFPPTKAKYVRLGMYSNWGGKRFEFGEFEVLADGPVPENAAPEAANVWPNVAATGFRPSISWQFLVYAILTAAEILVSITCLEFAYTQAPKVMKSVIMSLFLVSIALGNTFTAAVNAVIQNDDGSSLLPGASYYLFFAAVMFVSALAFVVVAMLYRGTTHTQDESE